jgi:hypothetical protein
VIATPEPAVSLAGLPEDQGAVLVRVLAETPAASFAERLRSEQVVTSSIGAGCYVYRFGVDVRRQHRGRRAKGPKFNGHAGQTPK